MNPELINLYRVVKQYPERLSRTFANEKFQNDEEYFRQLKAEFNTLIGTKKRPVDRAALLISSTSTATMVSGRLI